MGIASRWSHLWRRSRLECRVAFVRSASELRKAIFARLDEFDGISFDIFDTLLRRRVAPPEVVQHGATAWLARRLTAEGVPCSAASLWQYRLECERALRQASGGAGGDEEYALRDLLPMLIGKVLSNGCDQTHAEGLWPGETEWATDLAAEAAEYEIAFERAVLEPMPGMNEILAELQSNGCRVMFCSDMYLAAEDLRSLLESCGYSTQGAPIYVSCEHRLNKRSGRLFQRMVECERATYARWLHIGDDPAVDLRPARSLGISAIGWNASEERRRRRRMAELYQRSRHVFWRGAFVAAAAEIARDSADDDLLYRYGRCVLGFPFAVFTHRLIERIAQEPVDSLMFVARDGFLLKKLYERTVDRLAARTGRFVQRGPNVVYAALSRRSTAPEDDNAVKLLAEYLRSIGFFGASRTVALVDVGWQGTIVEQITRLYGNDRDFPRLRAWCFGVRCGLYKAEKTDTRRNRPVELELRGLIFDGRTDPIMQAAAEQCLPLWEEAARAPHGTTLEYRQTPGGIVPVFADCRCKGRAEEIQSEPALAAVQRGILEFADVYADLVSRLNYSAEEMLPFAQSVVCRATCLPRRTEADALLAAIRHQTDVGIVLGDERLSLRTPRAWRALYDRRQPRWRQAMLAQLHPVAGWLYSLGNLLRKVS